MTAVKDIFCWKTFARKVFFHKGFRPVFMADGVLGPGTVNFFLCLDETGIVKKSAYDANLNNPGGKRLALNVKTMY